MLTYNEPALNFYARLRVVRLLEVLSASSFHNSAFRISEVELIGRPGTSLRGFGILAFRLFAGGFLVRTAGFQLALIRGYICGQALPGTFFNDAHRLLDLCHPVLAPPDFLGDAQPVLQRSAVRSLSLGKELRDLFFQQLQLLTGVAVAYRAVLAGVGENFCAVHGNRDVPHFQNLRMRSAFKNLMESALDQLFVLAPELADRVMVRVRVRTQIPNRYTVVREPLNLPTRKRPAAVTVNQQSQHHRGRVLRTASTPVVGLRAAHVEQAHRIHHKMNEVILRHPVPQIRWQQKRGVVINSNETSSHTYV